MIEPRINNNNESQIAPLNRQEFVEELSEIIKRINIKSFKSIYTFFTEFISEFDIIVDNLVRTGRSDVIITYGNNCDLSKILISHVFEKLQEKDSDIEIITLNFNAYIHEKEEDVLNEICTKFGLESQRNTFESTCKTIENYFKYMEDNNEMDLDVVDTFTLKNCYKNKRNKKTIYVIYYDNIEFLFHKQKQVLFYTLLEIVNISKNIIFCGTSRTFNLTDLMEKRIRSRFSQKTFYLDLININEIVISLKQLIVNDHANNLNEALQENLTKNENFNLYIEKCYYLGFSIRELFFNLKLLFSNITIALKKDNKTTISSEELKFLIDNNVMKLFSLNLSNLTYLYKLPKIHIIVLANLIKSIAKHKEKIFAGLIYDEYKIYVIKNKSALIKYDIFKKILEELHSAGVINCKRDDKYTFIYEVKYTLQELKSAILRLENKVNFEEGLRIALNEIY